MPVFALVSFLAEGRSLALDIIGGAFLVARIGGLAMLVVGAIMFFFGRRKETPPASTQPSQIPK